MPLRESSPYAHAGGGTAPDGDYLYALALTATNALTWTTPAGLVTVDTQPPGAPVITAPTDPTSTADVSIRVEGTAEADTAIIVQSAAFTVTTPVDDSGTWSLVMPLESGRNDLTATATDGAGQVSDPSNSVAVWLVVQPPLYSVAITPDIATHGTVIDLGATARGDDSPEGPPTVYVTATVPNDDQVGLIKEGTHPLTTTWSSTWTVSPATADGLRDVSFVGVDQGGMFGSGDTALVIDSVGPGAPWLGSPRGQVWVGQAQVTAEGDSDPLDRVTVYANGAPAATVTADANGNWSAVVSLPQAENTLQARATDLAGNQSGLSNAATVRVDLDPPTTTLTAPQVTAGPFQVEWSADDGTGSGVVAYDVQYRDAVEATWSGWFTATTQTEATFSGELHHTYTFWARARDLVGHQSDWVQASTEVVAVTKYYQLGGKRVAMRRGSVVYYLQGDHLGSTSLVTDQAGNKVAEQRYEPWGVVRWQDGTMPTDFAFTGQRAEAFGLLDYNARYYSPRLQRFISADSIVPNPGDPQSLNRYSYAGNNPVLYRDPSGHAECVDAECRRVVHPITRNVIQRRAAPTRSTPWVRPNLVQRSPAPSPPEPGIPVSERREKLEKGFGIGATAFDTIALAISGAGALAEGAGFVAGVVGEPSPGAGEAIGVGIAIEMYYTVMNPFENTVSTLGAGCAAAADIAGGKTYLDVRNRELVIGQDTIVSSGALALGNQPVIPLEGIGDSILNFGLVGYDVGRLGHAIPSVAENRLGFSPGRGGLYMDLVVYGSLAERFGRAPGDRLQIMLNLSPEMGWVK